MIRKSLLLGITALMALGVFALGGDTARAEVGAGSMDAMSIDMDTTGNTATSIGTIEDCVVAVAGAVLTVDLVAVGIPADYPLGTAYAAELLLSDAALQVTDNLAKDFMINAAAGSNTGDASEPLPGPGPDDVYAINAYDLNGATPASAESGDGVLSRLTIEVNATVPAGLYEIGLGIAAHVDPAAIAWDANVANGGSIAVGVNCPSFVQGDVDCSGSVTSVDSLKILRHNAGLSVAQTEPCDDIGTGTPIMGDVDCNLAVSSVDALKILRHNAGLPVSQIGPEPDACPNIGT